MTIRPQRPDHRAARFLPFLLVVLAAAGAYANIFGGQFVFDDVEVVSPANNPALEDPAAAFTMHRGERAAIPAAGRPLANLTFVLCHHLAGAEEPFWYHLADLLIHILAALALLGVVNRALRRDGIPRVLSRRAPWCAAAVACLWAVHPLTTATVTYVSQRSESLMALFYLLTIYCFLRAAAAGRPAFWLAASVAACGLGAGCKEVIATAPVAVLLLDRCFVAGGFRRALKVRWPYYLLLAAVCWGILAALVGSRHGTVGYGSPIGPLAYAATQCYAVSRYLLLCAWPAGLVFDYGVYIEDDPAVIIPRLIIVASLLALAVRLLWSHPRLGFLCLFPFLALAPTSTVVPVHSQTIGEHRMYLPLAAVVALLVPAGWWALLRLRKEAPFNVPKTAVAVAACLVVILGIRTWDRNRDYHDPLALWEETVRTFPASFRPWLLYGNELREAGRPGEALAAQMKALRIMQEKGWDSPVHLHVGLTFLQLKRYAEAAACFRRALEDTGREPVPLFWLGRSLIGTREYDAAAAVLTEAIDQKNDPDFFHARAIARMGGGEHEGALRDIARVIDLTGNPACLLLRAKICADLGRDREARADLRAYRETGRPLPPRARKLLETLRTPGDAEKPKPGTQ